VEAGLQPHRQSAPARRHKLSVDPQNFKNIAGKFTSEVI
jgi:hypothetical protein